MLNLADTLEELPDKQREAIVLHYWQHRKVSEIADEMESTPAAVAGLLKRGLRKLREHTTPLE